MRVPIIAAFVLTLAAGGANCQTHVSGDISTHTTWDIPGSPYIVQGLTEVTNNSVLTIDPGVTVKFDGFYLFRATAGSSIYAVGTQSQRILFTSNSGTPAAGDWIWVDINDSPASHFAYCDLEYSNKGLYLVDTDLTITHCVIRHVNGEGIICDDSSPTIESCNIHDTFQGIYVYSHTIGANPVISGCNLYDNDNYNLTLTGFADPPLVTIDAEGNWWGTNVEVEIEATIQHDVDDGAVYAHADFDPWLTDTPVESTTWGRVKALFAD